MYFSYIMINKNKEEVFNTIEAKDIDDAINKIKAHSDFLYLIEVKKINGGNVGLQVANTLNNIKEKNAEQARKKEEARQIKENEKLKKEIQKAIKNKHKEYEEDNLSDKDLNMSGMDKVKLLLLSDSISSFKSNFKTIKQSGRSKKQQDIFKNNSNINIKGNIKKDYQSDNLNIKENSTIGNIRTEEELIKMGEDLNISELNIAERREPKGKGKIKDKDILLFTKQLQLMIKSQISLTSALDSLAKSSNEKLNNMILDLRDEVLDGNPLSYAMSFYPQYFDTTYLALVQIGEKSTSFENVLGEIVEYKEKRDKITRKIKTVAIYPIILGLLISVIGVLGSWKFIPVFEELYETSEMPVPGLTQAIFTIAGSLHIIIPIIFLIIFIIRLLYKRVPGVQNWWDKIWHKGKVKLPIIKNITKNVYMYNFTSTLSIMQTHGISLQNALILSAETINNMYVREEVRNIEELITVEGYTLSDAVQEQKYFDDLIQIITLTGEKTGDFATIYKDMSIFYNKEINSVIDATMAMVEPISIIILGIIVLPIVVGLYMPMLEMSTGGFLDV